MDPAIQVALSKALARVEAAGKAAVDERLLDFRLAPVGGSWVADPNGSMRDALFLALTNLCPRLRAAVVGAVDFARRGKPDVELGHQIRDVVEQWLNESSNLKTALENNGAKPTDLLAVKSLFQMLEEILALVDELTAVLGPSPFLPPPPPTSRGGGRIQPVPIIPPGPVPR